MKDWMEKVATFPAAVGILLILFSILWYLVPDERQREAGLFLGILLGLMLIFGSFSMFGGIPK